MSRVPRGLKNRSWVDLVDVVFHKSRGRCIRNFTYQVNRVHQITKRTLGLAEGLRKLVAGALPGSNDKVTKTSPPPSDRTCHKKCQIRF